MNFTIALVHRISNILHQKVSGYRFLEAFSSGRDELYIQLRGGEKTFGIRLSWAARSCFLFFNEDDIFSKPVPHHLQFTSLYGKRIISVKAHQHNRSFQMNLDDGYALVFKLYNGLSNVLLYKNEVFVSHFRTAIESDLQQELKDFNKEEPFHSTGKNELEDAPDLFEAFNDYGREYLSVYAFDELQKKLVQQKRDEIKRCKQLISKSAEALELMRNTISPEETGHIIMANLHAIAPKQTQAELFDFYRNKPVLIKLKKDLNPQQNAEYYYRKARNRKAEEEQLVNRREEAEKKMEELSLKLAEIEKAGTIKELRSFAGAKKETKQQTGELFKEFECEGFKIWVGKNAANNDVLTMKHSHKNDLWLHAKDVSGSHVVIKHQAGKPFTKKVISYAASLAAYYSKLKGSGLVPVAYTERKYVRKPKGANPGAVVLEKEEVIMAEPGI